MNINRNFNYNSFSKQNVVRQSVTKKSTPEKTNETEKKEETQPVKQNKIQNVKSEPLLDELNIISINNTANIKTVKTAQPKQNFTVQTKTEDKVKDSEKEEDNKQISNDDKMTIATPAFISLSSIFKTVWDIASTFLPKILGTIVTVMTPTKVADSTLAARYGEINKALGRGEIVITPDGNYIDWGHGYKEWL